MPGLFVDMRRGFMTATPLPPLRCFAVSTVNPRVDATKGIIFGVSLITSGLIAKGHDLEVDKTTLTQMLSCAEAKKKVPVKWNHKTGADAVSGYLKNFRIEDNKLVGDWHLLKSHERYAHALELATEMPECLGLSTSFRGEDEVVGAKKFARCTDLVSADLVASPAANPDGFFEEAETPPVDSSKSGMAKPSTTTGAAEQQPAKEFTIADVMAGITALNGRIGGLEERVTNFETALQEQDPEDHEFEEEEQPELTEFANGSDALQYLQERLAAIEDEKEQAKIDHAFEVYENKVAQLVELNEQLVLENKVMAEAITEFTTKTGAKVTFSPGTEGNGYVHHLSVPETDGRAPTTDFEVRVAELSADGKEATVAIRTAMKEDPARYQRHLQEIGVAAKRL